MRLALLLAFMALSCTERKPPTEPAPGPESCIDAWLAAHQLNSFGDPLGTVYAGGTPLFDEKTGATRDRLERVRSKQPAAAQACAGR